MFKIMPGDNDGAGTWKRKQLKFYVASGLENAANARMVADALKAAGHIQTYDWTQHGSVQGRGEQAISRVGHAEKDGVLAADLVVALLPGGRGTHMELGIALGTGGKRIILCADSDERLIQDSRTCALYYNGEIERIVGPLDKCIREILRMAGEMSGRAASSGEIYRRYRAGEAPIQIADDLDMNHSEVLHELGLYESTYGRIRKRRHK